MEEVKKKRGRVAEVRQSEAKWTKTLMDAGFMIIPDIILKKQHALGLDATDMNIILQIASYWWTADNPPFPSKRALAEAIGVDTSTIRRRIARLEDSGFIERVSRNHPVLGQRTNIYKLDGLIKEALPFAKEEIAARQKKKEEERDRRSKKKPDLKLVSKG